MKTKCCSAEIGYAHVSDQWAGDVLLSARVEYCTECLYVIESRIDLSK